LFWLLLKTKALILAAIKTKALILAALKDKGFYLWLREKNTAKGLATRSIDSKTHIKEAP
jgi:hypothetical protein